MAGLDGVPARRRAGCPDPAISTIEARLCPPNRDRQDKPGDDESAAATTFAPLTSWVKKTLILLLLLRRLAAHAFDRPGLTGGADI
jgi:hypothetical protein